MSAAGGAAGAIIAARRRRIEEIIDTFRLADATAPDRSRSLETLALTHSSELQALIVEGVVMPGTREGTYYLSEVGYIYQRSSRKGLKAVVIVTAIVLLIGLLILPLALRSS